MILSFIPVLFCFCTSATPPRLPNIGYLRLGYDLLFGNPHALGEPDAGFREPIFNFTKPGGLTPDEKHSLPAGTYFTDCVSCALDFGVKYIQDSKSYQSSLETDVSASFSGWGFSFSGSVDFKKVVKDTSHYSNRYVSSTAACTAYCGGLTFGNYPDFSVGFQNVVKLMPVAYDETFLTQLVGAYGTHFVEKIVMGSSYGMFAEFTTSAWSTFVQTNIDVKTAASYAGLFHAGVSINNAQEKQEAETFLKYSSDVKQWSKGSMPPSSGNVSTWISMSHDEPGPSKLTLRPMSDLLNSVYFPNDKNIAQKQKNLIQFYGKYCQLMMNAGRVQQCKLPTPPTKQLYACPASTQSSPAAWASYGCVGQLSSSNVCHNIAYNAPTISLPCKPVNVSATKFYKCPVDRESGDGAWASYGCLGQVSLSPQCTNYWWNNGLQSLAKTCSSVTVAENNLFECPIDSRGMGGGPWESIGCVGQVSVAGECINVVYGQPNYVRQCSYIYS